MKMPENPLGKIGEFCRETYHQAHGLMGPRRARLMGGLFFCGWVLILLIPGISRPLDRGVGDAYQRLVQRFRSPDQRFFVLGLDTETLQTAAEKWPWSRKTYLTIFEKARSTGAELIILQLPVPESTASIFASDSAGASGAVSPAVSASSFALFAPSVSPAVLASGSAADLETMFAADPRLFVCRFETQRSHTSPAKALRELVVRSALDEDDHWRFLEMTSGAGFPQNTIVPGHLVQFSGGSGGIPRGSLQDLLGDHIPAEALQGKIVLIGPTSPILHDFRRTAFGNKPGVEVVAAFLENRLTGHVLQRAEGPGVRLLLWLAGALGCLAVLRFSARLPYLVAGVGGACGLLLVVGMAVAGVLLPAGIFLLSWAYVLTGFGIFELFHRFVTQTVMQAEGKAVAQVQSDITPKKPWVSTLGFQMEGFCLPCDEAAGDYFDYFEQKDKTLLFFVGDVSGHGYPAGMIAAMAKGLVFGIGGSVRLAPPDVFCNISGVLLKTMQKKMTMTAVCGLLNPETRELTLSFAGHVPAIWVSATGDVKQVVTPGFPLGIRGIKSRDSVMQTTVTLEPGDRLLFCTDGIIECSNWQEDALRFARWKEYVGAQLGQGTVAEFFPRALEFLRTFTQGKPFGDDVTMLVLSMSSGRSSSS